MAPAISCPFDEPRPGELRDDAGGGPLVARARSRRAELDERGRRWRVHRVRLPGDRATPGTHPPCAPADGRPRLVAVHRDHRPEPGRPPVRRPLARAWGRTLGQPTCGAGVGGASGASVYSAPLAGDSLSWLECTVHIREVTGSSPV